MIGKKLLIASIVTLIFSWNILDSACASNRGSFKLLFFFSATCPHCKRVLPVVERLSREYPVEGLLYGKAPAPEVSFPVRRGSMELKDRYKLRGVPSLVVLEGERPRTVLTGERDIRDASFLLMALKKGALTVSEAMEDTEYEFLLTGWLIHKGDYFKGNGFFITDRFKEIPVKPWLPLETVKAPLNKKRPMVMSDLIEKPLLLKVRLLKRKEGYVIHVEELIEWKE